MNDVIYRRRDCRACGSHDLVLILRLRPSPIGDAYVTREAIDIPQPSYPIDLHMCRQCGLVQLLDVIDQETLNGEHLYVTASPPGVVSHFQLYADDVIRKCGLRPDSLVVDLGSHHGNNGGVLLKRFHEKGMRILSVEPSAHVADRAAADGINTMNEPFTPLLARRIVAELGHANIIVANNVFANVDDLMSWANAVNEMLADDGLFIFESIYLADLVRNKGFDFIYHEHLSTFSVKPIQTLFNRVGLELVAVQPETTKGGSLRYFVQRSGGPLARDGSVEEALTLEESMGLCREETYAAFADEIDSLKNETLKFLADVVKKGNTIAGFGASLTVTTLISHFEIAEYLNYLVDDNSAKQGRFSPGLHLPVLPSSAMHERKPDYVIVLAWRYAEQIIKKHQAYLESGGCFAIPLPEFKIIAKQ